jgi:glycerophosphoryl diester phosphodiesterase
MTLVLAHRGAHAALRENTLAAFREALALGADGIELDVRATADGALAVHHDAELPGFGPLVSLRAASLPPWLPLLDEVLEQCGDAVVNVEVKHSPLEPGFDARETLAAAVASCITSWGRHGGRLENIVVSSFSLATIDVVRAGADLETAFLIGGASDPLRELDRAVEHGHTGLHPAEKLVTGELVERAGGAGMAIRPWTVDAPRRVAELVALDVDAIVTNEVVVAVEVARLAASQRSERGE